MRRRHASLFSAGATPATRAEARFFTGNTMALDAP